MIIRSPTMVKELPEGRGGLGAASLFPIHSVESLVHEGAETAVEVDPLGHWLRERGVVVDVGQGARYAEH